MSDEVRKELSDLDEVTITRPVGTINVLELEQGNQIVKQIGKENGYYNIINNELWIPVIKGGAQHGKVPTKLTFRDAWKRPTWPEMNKITNEIKGHWTQPKTDSVVSNNDDPWQLFINRRTESVTTTPYEVFGLTTLEIEQVSSLPIIFGDYRDNLNDPFMPYYPAILSAYNDNDIAPIQHYATSDVIDFWTNTDLLTWLHTYGLENPGRVRSNEEALKPITVNKTTLVEYPSHSRPVIANVAFEEFRTVTGRLYSVKFIRKETPDPKQLTYDFCKAYFSKDYPKLMEQYSKDLITYDPKSITEWVNKKDRAPMRMKEVLKTLAAELTVKPMSDINVHTKLESLIKDEPIMHYEQQQARSIMWQWYSIGAIFSHIFLEAKKRFNELLRTEVLYADGVRPDELAARVSHLKNINSFFENDLTKQDRQTDEPILEVEFLIYQLLGVHPLVLSAWRSVHKWWRWKSRHCRGEQYAMRLTGQATTSLGNTITNMQVHCKFVLEHLDTIKLILLLGDDSLIMSTRKLNMSNLSKDIATMFNMQAKPFQNETHGVFCRWVFYPRGDGTVGVGPDWVRLNLRYEVTNGQHISTDFNLHARSMSYCMTLGDIPQVQRVINKWNYPITPLKWYEPALLGKAVAAKWEMSYDQAIGYMSRLCQQMYDMKPTDHKFLVWGNKPAKR
jgi:hypothetical protein